MASEVCFSEEITWTEFAFEDAILDNPINAIDLSFCFGFPLQYGRSVSAICQHGWQKTNT
jgi:hypothetical protein